MSTIPKFPIEHMTARQAMPEGSDSDFYQHFGMLSTIIQQIDSTELLVVRKEGAPIAVLAFQTWGKTLYTQVVEVVPGEQKQGIATDLVLKVREIAAERGLVSSGSRPLSNGGQALAERMRRLAPRSDG